MARYRPYIDPVTRRIAKRPDGVAPDDYGFRREPSVDPSEAIGNGATAAEPAERRGAGGRPRTNGAAPTPGTAAKPAAKAGTSLDLSAGIGLVQGFYAVLSIPGGAHWMMPEAEAKQFVIAWQNVLRHYPISVTQKAFDIAMCVSAMTYLNLPRVLKTVQLQKDKARGQPPRPQAQILRFAQPGGGGGNAGAAPPPGSAGQVGPVSVTTAPSPAELGIMAEGPPDVGAFS